MYADNEKLKAHEARMATSHPLKIVCSCGDTFASWSEYGAHVDAAISTPAETPAQAVRNVLADHLGELDRTFGFQVRYAKNWRVTCACGEECRDLHAWREHLAEALLEVLKTTCRPSTPSCLCYEDTLDGDEDDQPQVGDYGIAVRENAHGQEEIPFHIVEEENTRLPVAVLNTRLYAEPGDDYVGGQYVSLLQLYLDGYALSRTGRRRDRKQGHAD